VPFLLAGALRASSTLLPLVQPGLSAMLPVDRTLVAIDIRTAFGDGVDLDGATAAAFPNDHRWDYILSVPEAEKLIGVEPHSAGDGEVRVVINKKKNAMVVLREHLRTSVRVSEWHWITHGRVRFSDMSKTAKMLSQNGIAFRGRQLKSV
jgi:hypothetical protein